MKRSKKIILIALVSSIALFVGCSSSKQPKETVAADTYTAESDSGDKISVDEVSETTDEAKAKKKKEGFSLSKSLSNLFASKFYAYDTTSLFSTGTFGGIKQQTADMVYYPKTDMVGFGSPIMAAYYYLTFDEPARKKIATAVDQYLSDFENKRLDRKSKKSFKIYGNVKSKLYWGTVKTSSPNNGAGTINLGYEFVKNSPYFKLSMFPITNELYTGPDCGFSESSITLEFYFTKAQAQAFANLLSNESVAKAIQQYELETFGSYEGVDEYYDDDIYDAEETETVEAEVSDVE